MEGDDCITACLELKKTDDGVNGVTVSAHGSGYGGCFCEKGMYTREPSSTYKSCYFSPKEGIVTTIYFFLFDIIIILMC